MNNSSRNEIVLSVGFTTKRLPVVCKCTSECPTALLHVLGTLVLASIESAILKW